ncbi:MAG: hypothetical protein M3083_12810 [Actinomycetota bacterium]|nr:hypothetical protein [Actinomycetota bacterium]
MTTGETTPQTDQSGPRPAEDETTVSPVAPARAETPKAGAKGAFTVLALVALVASALVGGNLFGLRDRLFGSATPKPAPPAVSRSAASLNQQPTPGPAGAASAARATTAPPAATVLRSEPWWQSVVTRQGEGPMTALTFNVDASAIQWRVKSTCQVGHFSVRASGRARPVVDASCPGTATGYSTQTVAQSIQVVADGPWQIQVDQQVDVPLVEPPLAAMTAPGAKAVRTGSLYKIDQSGSGRVTAYQLADGTYALRLDQFFVSPNIDLEIRFSPLEAPHSTDQYTSSSPSDVVAPLDITAGSLNFVVPKAIDPMRYHSVVIWCPLIQSAYAAATLAPVG